MGAIFGIARWLIGIFNGIFGVCTVGMVAGGIIIKFASNILKQFGQTKLDEIKVSVDAMFPGQSWNTDSWDLNDILGNVALFLIVAGAVLLILCIIGCSATCLKVKGLLIGYTAVVAVLLLTQIILLIIVYASPYTFKDPVKTSLRHSLKNFQGLNGTNTNSLTWNFMMRYYACCGVANYQDFKDYSTWWGITEHVTPYACCVDLPATSTEADTCAGISANLPSNFLTNSNFDYGCVDAAGDFFFVDNQTYIILAIVLVFLAQIVLIVCSIVLTKETDGKVQPWTHDEYSRSRPPKLPASPSPSLSNLDTVVPKDTNYRTRF